MSDKYTPTEEEVRSDYVMAYADQDSSQLLAGSAFDRFISQVKAKAWDGGMESGQRAIILKEYTPDNPYQKDEAMTEWDEKAQLVAEYFTGQKRMPKVTAEYVEPLMVDMARWQREEILSYETVELAARALYNYGRQGGEPWDVLDDRTYWQALARTALTVALKGE